MSDETRRLLKVFGVAVTDFEDEAEKLIERSGQLAGSGGGQDAARLLKDATELCRELNTRWMDTTQHVFAIQNRLLSSCAAAGGRATT